MLKWQQEKESLEDQIKEAEARAAATGTSQEQELQRLTAVVEKEQIDFDTFMDDHRDKLNTALERVEQAQKAIDDADTDATEARKLISHREDEISSAEEASSSQLAQLRKDLVALEEANKAAAETQAASIHELEESLEHAREHSVDQNNEMLRLTSAIAKAKEDMQKAEEIGREHVVERQEALKRLKKELHTATSEREEELSSTTEASAAMKKKMRNATNKRDELTEEAAGGAHWADEVTKLESEVESISAQVAAIASQAKLEATQRKKFFNMVQDLKGKIRVYCRVRPMGSSDIAGGHTNVVNTVDEFTTQLMPTAQGQDPREYVYDEAFGPETTQAYVFGQCEMLIQSAFDGYNVCIMAYGQTGGGKTYTIHGEKGEDKAGLSPRAAYRLFEIIDGCKDEYDVTVSCYMLELYNDRLADLLAVDKDPAKLQVKLDPETKMIYVQNSRVVEAKSPEELLNVMNSGAENRHVAETLMNCDSSRSHLIFSILINTKHKETGQISVGKLSLIDLAGSERVGKTGAEGQQLREAQSINKSLSALGNVISALSSEQGHIPYRNSLLTLLLMDSVGGAAKTLMFVNISPSSYNHDETLNTLDYGQRAKSITNILSASPESMIIARSRIILDFLMSAAGDDVLDDDLRRRVEKLMRQLTAQSVRRGSISSRHASPSPAGGSRRSSLLPGQKQGRSPSVAPRRRSPSVGPSPGRQRNRSVSPAPGGGKA